MARVRKLSAAFTIVRNESVMLPVWLRYYLQHFKDVYVLNDNSREDSFDSSRDYNFHRIDLVKEHGIKHEWHDIEWLRKAVKRHQRKLLRQYKWVLFTEVDEFVVPDPEVYTGLQDYISQIKKDHVYCRGYNVIQVNEPPIDWDKPLMRQRKWWWQDHTYSKPAISRRPLDWYLGFHREVEIGDGDIPKLSDPKLSLIHLQWIDRDLFMKRCRFKEEDYYRRGRKVKTLIPEKWRDAF
jgi:hypothetical protein